MGARGCIVLAVGTVEIARLIYDRESHAAAGGVRGQEEPVAGHRVEEQESHEPHRQSVGGVCGKDDWGDVDYTVDVGQRHHHHSERHGHCVRRGTRKILLQPQQHLSFAHRSYSPAHAQNQTCYVVHIIYTCFTVATKNKFCPHLCFLANLRGRWLARIALAFLTATWRRSTLQTTLTM